MQAFSLSLSLSLSVSLSRFVSLSLSLSIIHYKQYPNNPYNYTIYVESGNSNLPTYFVCASMSVIIFVAYMLLVVYYVNNPICWFRKPSFIIFSISTTCD